MTRWKGLILAGGRGNRLFPLTRAVNKHLLPVYDKPMIYYPLTTLMLAGITEFIVLSSPEALPGLRALLGDGRQWGLSIDYLAQERPGGVADGLKVAAADLDGCNVALILGDNVFFGSGLGRTLTAARDATAGATVFSYEVANPEAFGIFAFDAAGRPVDIEEKPRNPRSRIAATGLYFFSPGVTDIAAGLSPSARGELEITDVIRTYMTRGELTVLPLGRGVAWLDGGVASTLFEASQYVQIVEERTGLKIACPEEIALRLGLIDRQAFVDLVSGHPESDYRRYLERLAVQWSETGNPT